MSSFVSSSVEKAKYIGEAEDYANQIEQLTKNLGCIGDQKRKKNDIVTAILDQGRETLGLKRANKDDSENESVPKITHQVVVNDGVWDEYDKTRGKLHPNNAGLNV